MEELLELVKKLPQDQQAIFYKYMSVISVCCENIKEKKEFLASKNISLDTARALIRVTAIDITSLKPKYKLFQESGLEDLVKSCPEILRYDSSKVISRVKACQNVGKPYMIDGIPAGFLVDDQLWEAVRKVMTSGKAESEYRPTFSDEQEKKEELVTKTPDFIPNESYDMDVLAFERYERLSSVLDNVRVMIGATSTDFVSSLSSDDYLMREVGANINKSDKEIIKGCLKECFGIVDDGLDQIIDEILLAHDDVGGKRGL